MIKNDTVKIVGLKDEFCIEYEQDEMIRRHYFPYSTFQFLHKEIVDFGREHEYLTATDAV